jgi:hypothetical protein
MKISQSTSIGKKLLLWSVGGINLVILLILLSIWRTGDRTLNFMGNLFKFSAAESKVENFTPLVQRIENIQELSTTVQTIETVVPASAERKIGDLPLATTRLLYIARGEIKAGVDLSQLTDANIVVSNNSIEIDLPPAKILDSKIDVNRSRVYDYNRGFLNLGPDVAPQLQTLAQRETLSKMIATACQEGILDNANLKAKEAITQLLMNTDDRQVTVNITAATTCGIDGQNI